MVSWTQVLIDALSAVLAVVGVAATMFLPVIGNPIGGFLIGGGVSMLMTAITSEDASWAEAGMAFFSGAIGGLVSAGFSSIATGLVRCVGANVYLRMVTSLASRVGTGALTTYVTNGICNKYNGHAFNDNWERTVLSGAISGFISFGAEAFSICSSTKYAQLLIEGFENGTKHLRACYESVGINFFTKFWSTAAVDAVAGAVQTIIYKLLTTGKVDWAEVAIGSLVCGGLSIARSGMSHLRGQHDERLVIEALEEHENGGTLLDENGNEENDPNLENSRSSNEKVARKPGTTAILRDEDRGKKGRGESHQKRSIRHKSIKGADTSREGVASGTKVDGEKLPDGYKIRYNINKPGYGRNTEVVGLTHSEAQKTLGSKADLSQRACAEADAAQHLAKYRSMKTLGNTTAVTINTRKHGKQHITSLQPACKVCSLNPHRNLSNPPELVNHNLDRRGHMGTQLAPFPIKLSKEDKDKKTTPNSNHTTAVPPSQEASSSTMNVDDEMPPAEPFDACDSTPASSTFNNVDLLGDDQSEALSNEQSSKLEEPVDEDFLDEAAVESNDIDEPASNTFDSSVGISNPVAAYNECLPLVANASDCFNSEHEEILYMQELKSLENQNSEQMKEGYLACRPSVYREEYAFSNSTGAGERVGGPSSASSSSREPRRISYREEEPMYEKKNLMQEAGDAITGATKKGMDKAVSVVKSFKERAVRSEEEVKIAEIVQIIGWSSRDNAYRMINETTWPKLPEKLRLVAVSGVRRSGRTTLLHSLIYQQGYHIPRAQAVTSMLPIGVNLYILRDKEIAFLDVCDSMDSTGQKPYENPVLGSVLLEAFAYLCCDHMLYSLALEDGQADMSAQNICDWIKKRLSLLMLAGLELDGRLGAQFASIVLRTNRPSEVVLGTISELEELLNNHPCTEGNLQEISEERKQSLMCDVSHNVEVIRLEKAHVKGKTMKEDDEYKGQLNTIWNRISDTTRYHYAAANDFLAEQDSNFVRFTVEGSMMSVWNALISSDSIEKAIISAANKAHAQKSDSKAAGDAKAFWSNLNSFQRKLLIHNLNDMITPLMQEFEEEVEQAKQEKIDSLRVYLQYSAKIAVAVVAGSLDLNNVSLKEEGIRIGLDGLTYLNASDDSNIVDGFLLRFAIVDYGLLELLNHEDIYKYYSSCWNILQIAASSGFRLRLLAFPIRENAVEVLRYLGRKKELVGDNPHLYKNVLSVLTQLINTKVDISGLQNVVKVSSHKDGSRLNMDLLRQSLLEMEYEISVKVRELVKKAYENHQFASLCNEQALKLPGEWFDEFASDIYKTAFHQLDSRETNMLMEKIHVVIYKEVAMHFARDLIQQGLVDELFLPNSGMREDVARARGHFIAQLLDLAAQDNALFLDVMSTTRILPQLKECMRTPNLPDGLLSVVLKCFMWLMHANAHRDSPIVKKALEDMEPLVRESKRKDKVHDLDEVHRRERREKQIKKYGFVSLQCLDNKFLPPVFKRLVGHTRTPIDKSNQVNFLSFVDKLLYVAIDENDRRQFYEEIYRDRGELIINVAKILAEAAELLTPDRTNCMLQVINKSCHLLSKFMHCYKNERFEMELLYKSEESDKVVNDPRRMTTFKELTKALESIFRLLIQRRDLYKKKDSFGSALQSVVALLLNVQATSGISHSEVKASLDQDSVHDMSGIHETDYETNIICGTNHFAGLDPKLYVRAVSRAAFILREANPQEISHFVAGKCIQSCLEEVIKRAKSSLEMQERDKQDRQRAITKSLETKIGHEGSRTHRTAFFDRLQETKESSSPSRAESTEGQGETKSFACADIFIECIPLNQRVPKSHVGNVRFEEAIDLPKALALSILFNNDRNDSNENRIDELIKHLNKVLVRKEVLFMKLRNDYVKDMMKLKNISRALESCGHKWTTQDGEEGIKATVPSPECRQLINDFIEWMTIYRTKPVRRLYSTFEPCNTDVRQIGLSALLNERLPPAFFSRNQEDLSSLTLEQLNDKKSRGHELKPADACNYILVRVELNEVTMVQAVFSKYATLKAIQDQLIEDSMFDPEHDQLILLHKISPTDIIEKSSKFALYLKISTK